MQDIGENKVCTFCLKLFQNDVKDVETETMGMLKFLDLQLKSDGIPVICKVCSESLEKCFNFKRICLYTEDHINSFKNKRNNVKVDLKEVYFEKNENKYNSAPRYNNICRLCMEIIQPDCCMSLSDETKDVVPVKTILRRYFSEMDLDITKDPVICTSCNQSLHTYFNFIKNHLDIEDAIKQCFEIEKSSNKFQMAPNRLLQFESGKTCVDIRKNCKENGLYDETEVKLENVFKEEFQELPIKCEVSENVETDYNDVEKLNNLIKKCHEHEQNGETDLKDGDFVEEKKYECNIKNEKIDIKTEQSDGTIANLTQDRKPTMAAYSCEECTYETKHKSNLKKHMLIHKNLSEVTTYSCEICPYIAKQKHHLQTHVLIHKNASEVINYQCDICPFKTRYKHNVKKHVLFVHKPASEVRNYQCDICTFKARQKRDLKRHMLRHKSHSEVATYQCEICTFKTKHKDALKQHALLHKTGSEVILYQCDFCTHKTRHKKSLKQHMLIHKKASEVTMHSCDACTYQTKRKRDLQRHSLIHKAASEVTTYQCETCTFKTKHRKSITRHLLVHKNASEEVLKLVNL